MAENSSNVTISQFDYSIENHFNAMKTIHNLCKPKEEEEEEDKAIDEIELERLNSQITFLKEWKHFYYKPRTIRFSCENQGGQQGKSVIGEVNLPQFSSANVPKMEGLSSDSQTSKDFVLYVGGHVWALDWCPSVHQQSDCHTKCEYLAVGAHPPESSYHKIGTPLTGRGVIQIWCLLHAEKKEELSPILKNQRRQTRKQVSEEKDVLSSKRPRGRFRKESIDDSDRLNQMVEATAAQLCDGKEKKPHSLKKARGRPRKQKGTNVVDKENTSVSALVGDISQVSSEFLALTESPRSTDEHTLLKIGDTDVGLDESNGLNQMFLATDVQLCNAKPKKGRGRPRKTKDVKEYSIDLGTENESIPAISVNISQGAPGVLSLTEATRSTEEHAVLKSCDTDVKLDVLNREYQMVLATDAQLSNAKDKKPFPSKKARGRPRKKRVVKEYSADLNTANEYIPAISVDISRGEPGILALTEAPRSTEEHVLRNNSDTDAGFDDLNRENQMVQATDFQLCNAKKKKPLASEKARGRPIKRRSIKKKDRVEASFDLDTANESVPALAVDTSQVVSGFLSTAEAARSIEEHAMLKSCDTDVGLVTETLDQSSHKMLTRKRKGRDRTTRRHTNDISPLLLAHDEEQGHNGYGQDSIASSLNMANIRSLEVTTSGFDALKDFSLPRVVLCLAHNGKVAWDVKWRPRTMRDIEHKHSMGYLAVLLGNGSLEVWEVPSPRTTEILYSSCKKEGTDPRFVKLEPVFRCRKMKSGDRHSIPLTVEWSTSSPHDLLLAGCHDGTVALWKFSASASAQDTRPLLCFSADTHPIRALAWAPDERDEESANIVVTAGHGGVRFWDIRDPYRPLWDLNLVRKFIYSLDWLQDPRCVIMSFDDGTLKVLSLSKAACDVPVTGKPFDGTQQQGLHSCFCSLFPIWSVQASRLTGQVVYCSADGSVLNFQLTRKAVDKDFSRNRAPHFVCGSLTEEDTALTVNTPLPNVPLMMKKPPNECGDTSRSMRGFLSDLNEAKRANDQTPDHEPLALCYNNDPSFQIDSAETVPVSEGKSTTKMSKKRKPVPDSVQVGDLQKGENQREARTEVEVLPPKVVAMHRVRWNMNKGSERWVCYGGAAGIIRCQELFVSPTGARSLLKK